MPAFTDSKGRVWSVTFTVSVMRRVKEECGVNLAQLSENEFRNYIEVAGDPIKLSEVLYSACRVQYPGVSLEDFQDSIADDVLESAAKAFEESFLNFCPSRQREALKAVTAKMLETETEALKTVTESISRVTFSPSVTGSPESSGSIPAT